MRKASRSMPAGRRGAKKRDALQAQAAESGDQRRPRARERGHVDAIPHVVLQVVEIHERRFAEVIVGELELPHLGSDDRLRGRRKRRIAHGQRLVVRKVARLLLGGERVASQLHREHEVGLLDDLLAIKIEVRKVQQQWVLIGRGARRSSRPRAR